MGSLISQNIKRLLDDRKMKQTDLARAANIPVSTIYNIMDGVSKSPRIDVLLAMAKALSVSIYDLVGYESSGGADKEFYKRIILEVEKTAASKNIPLSSSQKEDYVNELYQFAKQKAEESGSAGFAIDYTYLDWLLKNNK